ncbi:MAG: hypothetical protein JXM68_05745, partial [Sedimentisphaerales bacterium]|nr:hypothetical protein [Sedimentisphaerales bacterium]
MLTSDTTILATLEPGNPIAGAADMGYNGVQGTGKAQLSDLAWVIGLIVVVIVSLLFAGWSIMRLSKWRRELGVISN